MAESILAHKEQHFSVDKDLYRNTANNINFHYRTKFGGGGAKNLMILFQENNPTGSRMEGQTRPSSYC